MQVRRFLALGTAFAVVAGCASHKAATVNAASTTSSGPLASQTVTNATDQGTPTVGKDAVDPSSLGLPLYPNADPAQTEGYEQHTKRGDSKFVVMATSDPFESVEAWYLARMPHGSETQHTSAPDSKLAHFDESDEGGQAVRSVQISWTGGETSIMLTLDTSP